MQFSDIVMFLCIGVAMTLLFAKGKGSSTGRLLLVSGLIFAGLNLWFLHWQAGLLVAVVFLFLAGFFLKSRLSRVKLARARWVGLLGRLTAGFLFIAALLPYYFFPLFDLPELDGPWKVGVRSFELTDQNRAGVQHEAKDQARRIKAFVWYPATVEKGVKTIPYWTREEALTQGVSLARNLGLPAFLYVSLAAVGTNSVEGATPAAKVGGFPLVVYSHGFWTYSRQNMALMEKLASHGYVVVSMSHIRDSATVTFADGSKVTPYYEDMEDPDINAARERIVAAIDRFMGGKTHEERTGLLAELKQAVNGHRIGESFRAWRDDMLYVSRAFQSGNLPTDILPVRAMINFEAIGGGGMSFGGTTAGTFCQLEEKCVAAVNLDGENFDFDLYDHQIKSALLMMLTDQHFVRAQVDEIGFNPTDYAYETWDAVGQRDDVHRMRLRGMLHLGLMDLTLSARSPVRDWLYGSIGRQRGLEATNATVLAFYDKYLSGKDNDFPDNIFHEYPEMGKHEPSSLQRWMQRKK